MISISLLVPKLESTRYFIQHDETTIYVFFLVLCNGMYVKAVELR